MKTGTSRHPFALPFSPCLYDINVNNDRLYFVKVLFLEIASGNFT